MAVLSVKLSPQLEAKLNALVRRRGQRKSDVVREAIERLVDQAEQSPKSVHDLIGDLMFDGPSDLSTNPKYMKGFGK